MVELIGRRARSARTAQRNALEPPLVGGGRQRPQRRRRARDADQALGALLQVDRVRRHRGQEAHRPLGRADDPRVRGGLRGSNADDVAKEIAIYRAHKAAPIAIVDDGEHRYTAALDTISRPRRAPRPRVRALHDGRPPVRVRGRARDRRVGPSAARGARVHRDRVHGGARTARTRSPRSRPRSNRTRRGSSTSCATRNYDGSLEAATAVRVASVLRYATGLQQLDTYQLEFGKVGTPSTVVEDLNAALTKAIDELTRPIDAIKHQAKTVTVGISRSDETLLLVPLVKDVLAAGAPRDSLTYRALRTLVALDPSVDSVLGWTRYNIEGETINVVDRGGIARDIPSRTEANPVLRGSKHRAAARTRGHRRARSQRRPHDDPRARGEGQPHDRHDAAARALPRTPRGRRGAPRARGLPRSLPGHRRPGDGDRAGDARRRARHDRLRRPAHRARRRASPTPGEPEPTCSPSSPPRRWARPTAAPSRPGRRRAVLVERAGARSRAPRVAHARRRRTAAGSSSCAAGATTAPTAWSRRAGCARRGVGVDEFALGRAGSTRRRCGARSAGPTSRSTRCSARASAARSTATPRWSRRTFADAGVADARGRHPVGSRRDDRRGARRRRCARTRPVSFAALKPGLLFEPGRDARGPRARAPTSASTSTRRRPARLHVLEPRRPLACRTAPPTVTSGRPACSSWAGRRA